MLYQTTDFQPGTAVPVALAPALGPVPDAADLPDPLGFDVLGCEIVHARWVRGYGVLEAVVAVTYRPAAWMAERQVHVLSRTQAEPGRVGHSHRDALYRNALLVCRHAVA